MPNELKPCRRGSSAGTDWMNYCPNCGAKMDGKDIDVTTKTDQVEVVRCGQCRHATDDIIVEGVCYCHKIQQGMFVDGFCSYGERREDNA